MVLMTNQYRALTALRWTARITGSLILVFLLFFLFGHLFGDHGGKGFSSGKEILTFLFFPVSTIVGLALAYRWEALGGAITLVGMAGLFALRYDLLNDILMFIPAIPGLLYFLSWWFSERNK